MSSTLGCHLSDRIAAIAPVSGVYFPPYATDLAAVLPSCTSTRPVAIIAFYGTADTHIPFKGGEFRNAEGLVLHLRDIENEVMPDWAAHNGCDSVPTEEQVFANVRLVQYHGCDQDATVELYVIEGGEHLWYEHAAPADELSADDLMWDFFQAHPLATVLPVPAATKGGF